MAIKRDLYRTELTRRISHTELKGRDEQEGDPH